MYFKPYVLLMNVAKNEAHDSQSYYFSGIMIKSITHTNKDRTGKCLALVFYVTVVSYMWITLYIHVIRTTYKRSCKFATNVIPSTIFWHLGKLREPAYQSNK